MKAQEARTEEISRSQQITPVIVKMGGGGPTLSSQDPNSVFIDSLMSFVEPVPGPTWDSSQSTFSGRIMELTIKDDGILHDFPITPSDQLASITVHYGSAQCIVMEVGNPGKNEVFLLITSPQVLFTVTERDPKEDLSSWIDSKATFTDSISRVVFMQGDTLIKDYKCTPAVTRLNIDFNRNS